MYREMRLLAGLLAIGESAMEGREKRSFIECQVHLGVRVRVPIAAVESRNATEGARAESISRRATEKGSA